MEPRRPRKHGCMITRRPPSVENEPSMIPETGPNAVELEAEISERHQPRHNHALNEAQHPNTALTSAAM